MALSAKKELSKTEGRGKLLILHPKSTAIHVTQWPLPPAHTFLQAGFDVAELASKKLEIRGAGVKYRKMGFVFVLVGVFVGGRAKRIFL